MTRNRLVDGEWQTDAPETTDEGAFAREATTFRDWVRDDPEATHQPGTGRYHVYISRSCPWAHGVALTRRLCGLTDVVTMDIVDPLRTGDGWAFTPEKPGCSADSILDAEYLRDVYLATDPAFTGRVTVPVLWDRDRETIVNNESIEIMRMLNDAFSAHGTSGVNLVPEDRRAEVDRVIEAIYEPINNGVYRAGFATTQEAYDSAVTAVFAALEHWDQVLAEQRYLVGDQLTLADVRLFPTLIRFDAVYHTHFKCNRRRIVDYPNLWPYLRDLYQTPGFAETVNMDHITEGYYAEHRDLNPHGIIPIGPDLDFEAPHDRARLGGGLPGPLAPKPSRPD